MEHWMNGMIKLSRKLSEQERKKFHKAFPDDQTCGSLKLENFNNTESVILENYFCHYPSDEAEEIREFLRGMHISLIDGAQIEYSGDYVGALRLEDGEWVDYPAMSLPDITTEELKRELEYRYINGIPSEVRFAFDQLAKNGGNPN